MNNQTVHRVAGALLARSQQIEAATGLRPVGVMLPPTLRAELDDVAILMNFPVTWGLTLGLIYDVETP